MSVNATTEVGRHSAVRADLARIVTMEDRKEQAKSAMILTGVGLASAFGLGVAFKDGLKKGFLSIAGISKFVCSLIAIPVVFLFPIALLMSEFNFLKGKKKGGDEDKLAKFINPMVSLSFAAVTFSDPLEKMTQSGLHMASGLLNLPHILFTFFSYTGGRFMTFLKTFQLLFKPPKDKELRLGQEADAFHAIGNIGSEHAGITPIAHYFATGCHIIKNLFKGDFSSLGEYFKQNPISFLLSIPSVITFIPDWIGKIMDTAVRTAEASDQIQNAFIAGKDSSVIRGLKRFREWWHAKSKEDSGLGKFLKNGRDFARFDKLVFAPFSLMVVVCQLLNKVAKLQFFNKEARQAGGFAKTMDTIFSPLASIGHIYFTGLYGLTVRLPQVAVSSIFYGSHFLNHLRGAKLGDKNYIEPTKVRDRVFNIGFLNKISDWSSDKLDKIELELHPDDPKLVKTRTFTRIKVENGKACRDEQGNLIEEEVTIQGRGRSKFIQSYSEVVAERKGYIPAREGFYNRKKVDELPERIKNKIKETHKDDIAEIAQKRFYGLSSEEAYNKAFKELKIHRLSDEIRGEILRFYRDEIIKDAMEKVTKCLIEVDHFTEANLREYKEKGNYDEVKHEVEELIKKEMKISASGDATCESRKYQIKAANFLEMITHPIKYWEDIKHVFSVKTFMAKFVWLLLNVKGFANGAEMGKEGESYKLRKHKAETQIIEVLDNTIAIESELPPVWMEAMHLGVLGAKSSTEFITSPGSMLDGITSGASEIPYALAG